MGKYSQRLSGRLNKDLKINFDGKQESVRLNPKSRTYVEQQSKGQQYKKVIFLDIEGVIVTHRSIITQFSKEKGEYYHGGRPGWHRFIDRCAMALVFHMAKEHGARICLSSTLRNDPGVVSAICCICPHWLDEEDALDMFTEPTAHGSSREEEIKSFIKAHDVEQWVAIDDRDLNLHNFVQTRPADGFSMQNFYDAQLFLVNEGESVKPIPIFL